MRPIASTTTFALGSATWKPWLKYTRLRIPVARRKAEPRICLEASPSNVSRKRAFCKRFSSFGVICYSVPSCGEARLDGFSAALLAVLGVILEKSHDSWTWRARMWRKVLGRRIGVRWLCRLIISGFLAQLGQRRISIIRHCTDEPSFWHRSRGFAICHLRARPIYPSA